MRRAGRLAGDDLGDLGVDGKIILILILKLRNERNYRRKKSALY
jgi:hypothetical protein